MSSKYRGTKRSFDSESSDPKAKFAKSSGPSKSFGGKGKFDNKGKFGGNKFDNKSKFGGNNGNGKFEKKWDNKGKFDKGKGKAANVEREEPVQRRKRPVTQGGGEEDIEDDDMSVDEVEEVPIEGEGAEEGAEEAEKRPKMTKEERAALHAAQPHRTTLLPQHALLTNTLLPLWEVARRSETPKDERTKAIAELWESTKGHVLEISRGHKGGRILQTIVKYGNKEQRTGVAMELEPEWRAMMESKYSKFLMSKLIRYCPSIRPLLVPVIAKNITSLLFHAHAIQPISDFYDLYASAKERRGLVRGFYPREVAIFDSADIQGLEQALESAPEAGRTRILEGVEKSVLDIFNATQKTALAQSIFHRLVNEYLTCIYKYSEDPTAKMHELLAASLESLPEIVHTKDGSAVVRELLVRGTAKDRKSILQVLRKHIEPIAKDADAQLVLFTAFDVVDDTKLMGKAFVADIVGLADSLATDKIGRRAVLYLLTASSRHFMPSTLATLKDSAERAKALGTSKKDAAVRRSELLSAASPGLLELVATKGDELVRDPGAGLLVQEIMLSTIGDKEAAIEGLVSPLAVPLTGDESHPLELAHCTRTYKTLLTGGHFNMTTKSVEVVDSELGGKFAQAFWKAISSDEAGGKGNAVAIAAAAPFVAVELLSALDEEAAEEVKEVLGAPEAREAITEGGMKGVDVLLGRL